MKKTYSATKSDVNPNWHFLDAEGKILGRLATEISALLTGKNKAIYTPSINVGDKVVVVNAEKVAVTGTKMFNKKYYRHSGYPGGFKEEVLEDLLERKPEEVLKNAVWGMLPDNKLRKKRMVNLYVYKGGEHPHTAHVGKSGK